MIRDDPRLVWAAILDAAREHHEAELADIAISLYGELGEARAEIGRLRAALRASLRPASARAASRPRTRS